jgi:hypothetical protein
MAEPEALLLTARELIVLIVVVAVFLWVARQLVREQRR